MSEIEVFDRYPYGFVQHIEAHRDLLNKAARSIPPGADVLDLGCALGFLLKHLNGRHGSYLGIDQNQEFVAACRELYAHLPNVRFDCADIMGTVVPLSTIDAVTLINVLYLASIDPDAVLRHSYSALRPGGTIAVSGPFSIDSFTSASDRIVQQLKLDQCWIGHEHIYEAIKSANDKLLTTDAHYWTAEEIIRKLVGHGFADIVQIYSDIFYGNGYLVIARRS